MMHELWTFLRGGLVAVVFGLALGIINLFAIECVDRAVNRFIEKRYAKTSRNESPESK